EGSFLKYNLDNDTGHMDNPSYTKKNGEGRGTGELLLFEGEDNYRLKKGSYTTCPEGNNDWYIRAGDLRIDNDKQIGTARNVSIRFKDVPILYFPWLDFSFSGKRKSGMLAPVFGNTARTGVELALPFYLNIAPNIDATITPRAMSKRGFMLNNEIRYMGESLSGQLLVDVLPNDISRNKDQNQTRYGVSYTHNQYLGRGWQGNLAYNRVSDDRYFRDISNNMATTSRRNLAQQAMATYHGALGTGGSLNVSVMAQRFQTLQDPLATFRSPYRRLPQLTMNAIQRNVAGMDLNLNTSWTNFAHDSLVDGHRFTMFPSVSVPLRNAFGYVTPKVGMHYTRYDLSSAVGTHGNTPDRVLPILSLDSGVVFDRNIAVRGQRFTQTLEPRAFYVYIPYTNQSFLPNFDSAESDFSFAQMLTENRFSGSDRINDANQVTLALTSRLIDPETGIERLRMAIGQQFRFQDRRVIINEQQITSRRADFIAAFSGRISSTLRTDTNLQFDEQMLRTEKIRTGISYQPEQGKVMNIGYRFTRDILEQVDTSVQWPFTAKLNGVARVNYSLQDDEMLAGLAGIEYRSCCWAFRIVAQRFTTATRRTSTAVFVQLELNGLMQIGANPLRVLQQSIPGYSQVN
ncbi:MAG: LPS-assembly protein LptD, partial [Nitrosomonas sp.]|nr:LPS-assembly protein LptD [Nitrosomonas sp.]